MRCTQLLVALGAAALTVSALPYDDETSAQPDGGEVSVVYPDDNYSAISFDEEVAAHSQDASQRHCNCDNTFLSQHDHTSDLYVRDPPADDKPKPQPPHKQSNKSKAKKKKKSLQSRMAHNAVNGRPLLDKPRLSPRNRKKGKDHGKRSAFPVHDGGRKHKPKALMKRAELLDLWARALTHQQSEHHDMAPEGPNAPSHHMRHQDEHGAQDHGEHYVQNHGHHDHHHSQQAGEHHSQRKGQHPNQLHGRAETHTSSTHQGQMSEDPIPLYNHAVPQHEDQHQHHHHNHDQHHSQHADEHHSQQVGEHHGQHEGQHHSQLHARTKTSAGSKHKGQMSEDPIPLYNHAPPKQKS